MVHVWPLLSLLLVLGSRAAAAGEVSYVLEPFEINVTQLLGEDHVMADSSYSAGVSRRMHGANAASSLFNCTTSTMDALFGNGSLRVEYSLETNAAGPAFGGLFAQVNGSGDSVESAAAEFTWITDKDSEPPYNCIGASRVSLWYKLLEQSNASHTRLRVVLFEDSTESDNFDSYYSEYFTLSTAADDQEEWNELVIDLQQGSGFTGGEQNSADASLRLDHIRGWSLQFQGHTNQTSGVILLDQLACVGGGDLFGAVFKTQDTFQETLDTFVWDVEYFQSEQSEELSQVQFLQDQEKMSLDYVVEQAEAWGGFINLEYMPPANAYYNLSQAKQLSLDYEVAMAASEPSRAHLRLILFDGQDCRDDCRTVKNHEVYYSFFYVLDDDGSTSNSTGSVQVALEGDTESTSPFWRTGWSGSDGNGVLDPAHIKGFSLEISIDSQGDIGSLVTGAVTIGNLVASDVDAGIKTTDTCTVEDGVVFNSNRQTFNLVQFSGPEKCCERCDNEPDCLYAFTAGTDCHMASRLETGTAQLASTEFDQLHFVTFWQDDATKRGDFCELCECREQDRVIDCTGADLAIVPKTFTLSWSPRVLDLSENPRLILLGTDALQSIAEMLEEVILPMNLGHLSYGSVSNLPALTRVRFEGSTAANVDSGDGHSIGNVLTSSKDAFGDICCGRGDRIDLFSPSEGLTFCNMQVDSVGVDSVYLNFTNYLDSAKLATLKPSSNFMAEAAESPQKCAEYCSIRSRCAYFSYDARYSEAEHTCYLATNNGTRLDFVCCDSDAYADEDETLPGWTSGYPPRTRNLLDNARVITTSRRLEAKESNKHTVQYNLALGSMPIRGAVWITPTVSSTNLNYTITPSRVVLYDNETIVPVTVTISNPTFNATLVIANKVQSCDTAFTALFDESADNLFVNVLVPSVNVVVSSGENINIAAIVVPLVVGIVISLAFIYIVAEKRRRQSDSVWIVKQSELKWHDPPEIIGRGTFGLVLLAEYRGTQVAVKRVLPPSSARRTSNNDEANRPGRASGNSFGSFDTDGTDAPHVRSGISSITSMLDLEAAVSNKTQAPEQSRNGKSSTVIDESKSVYRSRMSSVATREGGKTRALKNDFIAEMRLLSKLRHPCITTVMGAVMNKNEPLLVMEFMDHGSLYDLLHNETMILEGELLLPILRDITQGVRFLHSADPQVIHGDLKSANILIDSRLRAKVSDFGLSQKRRLGATGSPYWMAPELLRKESTNTAASDVYSFGIILYEAYSRREPYEGEDFHEVIQLVMDKAVSKRPPNPKTCPDKIKMLMNECLSADPACRPTVEELDLQLKRLDAETIAPNQLSFSKQSKKEALEQTRTNDLLFQVFPKHVAEALRDGHKVEPESKDMVTIFFSDIVGFTAISSQLSALKVSDMLDRLYNKFDKLSHEHDLFKVETIGDAFMCCSNLHRNQDTDHVKKVANFAIDAINAANDTLIDVDDPEKGFVNIRCGFHSGPVVANVVGSRNPRYCLFGDTVNMSSRMESTSEKNRVHCSESSAVLLKKQDPNLVVVPRGMTNIKGKGKVATYWVEP